MSQVATIRVVRFWTEYKTASDGTMREIDMVEYGPVGQIHMRTTRDTVSRLSKVRPVDPYSEDEGAKLAGIRWSIIEPQYRAWKKGQDVPEDGTPLAAWPGLTAEQLEIVRHTGLRSIEELAGANDAVLSQIKLPNTNSLREQAKLFLASKDKHAMANRFSAVESENKDLKDQLEEMRKIVLELQRARDADLNERVEEKRKSKDKAAA